MDISKEAYLQNPCGISSLPYWKAIAITLTANLKVIHDRDFREELLLQYTDEPYFRLFHELNGLRPAALPDGFSLCNATLVDYANHINQCYENISVTEQELTAYTRRRTCSPVLWIAVQDSRGELAATGIAELDTEIGEGVLEWIQVSPAYRGCGLGTYLVNELLWRLQKQAQFVTVSGQENNPANPEALYRKCGFTGHDVWHILREKE